MIPPEESTPKPPEAAPKSEGGSADLSKLEAKGTGTVDSSTSVLGRSHPLQTPTSSTSRQTPAAPTQTPAISSGSVVGREIAPEPIERIVLFSAPIGAKDPPQPSGGDPKPLGNNDPANPKRTPAHRGLKVISTETRTAFSDATLARQHGDAVGRVPDPAIPIVAEHTGSGGSVGGGEAEIGFAKVPAPEPAAGVEAAVESPVGDPRLVTVASSGTVTGSSVAVGNATVSTIDAPPSVDSPVVDSQSLGAPIKTEMKVAASLSAVMRRSIPGARRQAVNDLAAANDKLGFAPYVRGLRDFLLATATVPPLTISIEGEWGSGKSSFMCQLKDMLEKDESPEPEVTLRPRVIGFSPWRHATDESLWASFALSFIRECAPKGFLARVWFPIRLTIERTEHKVRWLLGGPLAFLALSLLFITYRTFFPSPHDETAALSERDRWLKVVGDSWGFAFSSPMISGAIALVKTLFQK